MVMTQTLAKGHGQRSIGSKVTVEQMDGQKDKDDGITSRANTVDNMKQHRMCFIRFRDCRLLETTIIRHFYITK